MCLKNALRNNFCRVWLVIMQFVCQDRSWHTKPNVAAAPDYFGGSFCTVCESGSFETCDNAAPARQGAHSCSIVRRAGTMRMYKYLKFWTCNHTLQKLFCSAFFKHIFAGFQFTNYNFGIMWVLSL